MLISCRGIGGNEHIFGLIFKSAHWQSSWRAIEIIVQNKLIIYPIACNWPCSLLALRGGVEEKALASWRMCKDSSMHLRNRFVCFLLAVTLLSFPFSILGCFILGAKAESVRSQAGLGIGTIIATEGRKSPRCELVQVAELSRGMHENPVLSLAFIRRLFEG